MCSGRGERGVDGDHEYIRRFPSNNPLQMPAIVTLIDKDCKN